jgi:hypothetical protein
MRSAARELAADDRGELERLLGRLVQPVDPRHDHVMDRVGNDDVDGENVLLGLPALVRAAVELAETEVAVGDEGTHAARFGEGQRLMIVDLGVSGSNPSA